jgi:predicted Fe-Mo cluster-binding NifX family protein
MSLHIAFAVNNNDEFENKHFGSADKYLIYKKDNEHIVFVSEEINQFKFLDEEREHGSKRKATAIINWLKAKGISVVVSTQFCKNIIMVSEHFIPVIIELRQPYEIINKIIRYLHWIKDEWENNLSEFNIFIIKSGILKIAIDKQIK